MEQNKNTLYGSDLIKLFAKKFKVLLIVGLVAAIIGGGLGVLFTSLRAEYRAEINISVSHVDDSNKLLYNLRSGRFAELLLLEANGLPAKEKCNAADYDKALEAIEAFESAREKRLEKYIEMSNYHMTDIESTYKRLEAEYLEAFELLKVYKEADGEGFMNNEDHLKMIAKCEEDLLAIQAKKKAYYDEFYLPADEKRVSLQTEYATLSDEVTVKRKAAEEATEKVLEAWRKTPGVADEVKNIMQYTSYDYFKSDTPVSTESSEAVAMERGYIKVSLAVPAEEKAFAQKIVNAYKLHICDYTQKQVEEISNQADVESVLINPIISLEDTADKDAYVKASIKYALVIGAAVVVLLYLILVFKMMIGDKKHPAE